MNAGKLFGIWTLLTALTISVVAAYYSIIGLTAIFAAAIIPIIIMGSALEVAKVTTAVWLHAYWHTAPKLMRLYLTVATIILMFITSMGIFGFLSRAHIEQTAVATEAVAKIDVIQTEMDRYEGVIARSEAQIVTIQERADNADSGIQDKIDAEQQRIDSAYTRIQPAIDEQNEIIRQEQAKGDNIAELEIQQQIDEVDAKIDELVRLQRANDARALQALVGAKVDGRIGPATRAAITAYESDLRAEKTSLQNRMARVIATAVQPNEEVIAAAREEIKRQRSNAEAEIANSLQLIERLRERVSVDTSGDIQAAVEAEYAKIDAARVKMDELRTERFALEKENRKLEAEVGPVKYIADLVYGDQADANTLEAAVRWVILLLVAVFDPLAVILVIAGIQTIERSSKKKTVKAKEEVDFSPEPVIIKVQEEAQQEDVVAEETNTEQPTEAIYTENYPKDTKFEDVEQELIDNEFKVEEDDLSDIEELLSNADEETLEEVYQEIIKQEAVEEVKEEKPLLPTRNGQPLTHVKPVDPKTVKNVRIIKK